MSVTHKIQLLQGDEPFTNAGEHVELQEKPLENMPGVYLYKLGDCLESSIYRIIMGD